MLLSTAQMFPQRTGAAIDWSPWKYYIGDWVGEGGGKPGQGSGGFSFYTDLQNSVLVRKNHSDFPATQKNPAYTHDDLMLIYPEKGEWCADYFDNEKHVIHYGVSSSSDSTKLIFCTRSKSGSPDFRLTYTRLTEDKVNILFEYATPAEQVKFIPYIEAFAIRKR